VTEVLHSQEDAEAFVYPTGTSARRWADTACRLDEARLPPSTWPRNVNTKEDSNCGGPSCRGVGYRRRRHFRARSNRVSRKSSKARITKPTRPSRVPTAGAIKQVLEGHIGANRANVFVKSPSNPTLNRRGSGSTPSYAHRARKRGSAVSFSWKRFTRVKEQPRDLDVSRDRVHNRQNLGQVDGYANRVPKNASTIA